MKWTYRDSLADTEKRYWDRFPKWKQEQTMQARPEIDYHARLDPSLFMQNGVDWRGEPIMVLKSDYPNHLGPEILPGYYAPQSSAPPGVKSTQQIRSEMAASLAHPQDGLRNVDPRTVGLHQAIDVDKILDNVASKRGLTREMVLALIDDLIAARIIRRT
jgi:hypothetical protein